MSMGGKERLNDWSWKDYVKNIIMILVKVPAWAVQWLLFWVPLKKNRIVIYSLKQHGYSCNLKYLTEYLRTEKNGEFEMLWIVKRPEDYALLQQRGIPVAMARSKEHFLWRHRAGIVITNDEFYPMCRKRRGQLYVNTWHGGINYKKIGYEGLEFTNPVQKLIYKMNNPKPDVFVSGSRSFTRTAAKAFRFPEEVFLECGLPRNDILARGAEQETCAGIKRELGIGQEKRVLLYAPTFRKGGNGPEAMPDFGRLKQALSGRFGGEWVILLRQHYFVESQGAGDDVIDVSRFEDMQQLLLISDCMISDYSSCMWDFLITGRPCFVYARDLADYRDGDRSFFIPTEQWPYAIAVDEEGLYRNIENFDAEAFAAQAAVHREEFGSRDEGDACRRLTCVLDNYLK